jgi:hypothetical protein
VASKLRAPPLGEVFCIFSATNLLPTSPSVSLGRYDDTRSITI